MPSTKVINDPVYGFVTVPGEFLLRIIDHPWFQRLRRIRQLGLTQYVYPGALHTRFHHALGAMHLMRQAIDVIRSKGHEVAPEEEESACAAILLHDVGHGPFSHALENVFIPGVHHEDITTAIMHRLNDAFDGKLSLAIDIFEGRYAKPFLHQLISGQLDVDRLDYLNRDSFFTGVSEGVIGYDRIIKMLQVQDGDLVVEQKGIYSIEKFLIARRLMYWQVYLHKTVLVTEMMIRNIFRRAAEVQAGFIEKSALSRLLGGARSLESSLDDFLQIDDFDVMMAIKVWQHSQDPVLSGLCTRLLNRKLLRIEWLKSEAPQDVVREARQDYARVSGLSEEDASWFVFEGSTMNHAYNLEGGRIGILFADGRCLDITEASDLPNIKAMAEPVVKFYLCRPKGVRAD